MYKATKFIFFILALYLVLNAICPYSQALLSRSIEHQIEYLDKQIANGGDSTMQLRYPEGYMFSNCLFVLALIEYAEINRENNPVYVSRVERSTKRILSDQALAAFDESLPLAYGAFYNGWANYTLKKYISSHLFTQSKEQDLFSRAHARLSNTLAKSPKTLLESYSESIWPADNLACIASLANSTHQTNRLEEVLKASQNELGLINHDNTNQTIARGSSQALILYFLSDILPELGDSINQVFEQHFITNLLGIQLVKEHYLAGESDLDSGPILFGKGSVATIMNIKTQATYNTKLKATWGLLNILGIPINLFGKKYYLFRKEMMFDLFMLWCSISLLQ